MGDQVISLAFKTSTPLPCASQLRVVDFCQSASRSDFSVNPVKAVKHSIDFEVLSVFSPISALGTVDYVYRAHDYIKGIKKERPNGFFLFKKKRTA